MSPVLAATDSVARLSNPANGTMAKNRKTEQKCMGSWLCGVGDEDNRDGNQ